MATGVAVQRKTYSGSGIARSVWQRNETDDAATVSANGYYSFADIATANIGDIIEIIGPDYFIQREITAQNADGSWVTGDYGGAGGGASLTGDQLLQIAKQKTQTPNVGDPVAIDQIVIGPDQKQWENTSGGATTMPATFDPVPTGWTEYTGAIPVNPEIITSAAPLTGAAPTGAVFGIDTTNNKIFKVDGVGDWQPLPVGEDELWFESTDNYVVEQGDRYYLNPGHTIDLTGLTAGEWVREEIKSDHTGNEGGYEVGAGSVIGVLTFGLGEYEIKSLGGGVYTRRILSGTATSGGSGTPSTFDFTTLITN